MADLAGLDELGHRADGLLDRRVLVDAVLVVEVEVVDSEALERCFAGLTDVGGVAAATPPLSVLAAYVAELRGEHDVLATSGDGAPDEPLVRERPVDVGGVEEVDAEAERAVDRRQSLLLVARPVELGHAHAAEPDRRHLEPLAEGAPLHLLSLPRAHGRKRTRFPRNRCGSVSFPLTHTWKCRWTPVHEPVQPAL